MYLYLLFSFFLLIVENANGTTSSAIPDLVYNCYTTSFIEIPQPPLTQQLLIELIRKTENAENGLNIRTLVTSMLHSVVLDGIRRFPYDYDESIGIPYRASGSEFYKYKLIVDYLVSGESSLFPTELLTTPELCCLHKIISNTVDPLKRGDESSTCVHQSSMPQKIELMLDDDLNSPCPIKQGVIQTKWGSVTAGHLITAIASALQQSQATFERIENAINKDEINTTTTTTTTTQDSSKTINDNYVNSIWVSTIAGDIAGVILNQHSISLEIGSEGFWNDTLLPKKYYLTTVKWDMTEPDLLGGIDGLMIVDYLKKWQTFTNTRLRLSQLIDMFYSERGMAGDHECKATNRAKSLAELLNKINLDQQIEGTIKLLQNIGTYDVYLRDDDISQLVPVATAKFKETAGNITKIYDNVEYINRQQINSYLEIIVIIDNSFSFYTIQRILFTLAEAAQVSYYGSKLGVINGQTGNWLTNITGDLFELFDNLQSSKQQWPTTLTLGQSLETINYYYQNRTEMDCINGVSKPLGRSILIINRDGRLTDDDLMNARNAMNSIKLANPEIAFMFINSKDNEASFDIIKNIIKDNDRILTLSDDVTMFVQVLLEQLKNIPGSIVNYYCKSTFQFEDYITPEQITYYQIREEYLKRGHVVSKFLNSNYGELNVCAITATNKVCKDLTVNGEVSFDSEELCRPESVCTLNYTISVNNSRIICTEDDCRYPDQVRLEIMNRINSGWAPTASKLIYLLICLLLMSY